MGHRGSGGTCGHCMRMGCSYCSCGLCGLGQTELLPDAKMLAAGGATVLGAAGEAASFWTRYSAAEGKKAPTFVSTFASMYSPREQLEKVAGAVASSGKYIGIGVLALIAMAMLTKKRG